MLQLAALAEATGVVAFVTSGNTGYFKSLTPKERMATRQTIAAKFPNAASPLTPL